MPAAAWQALFTRQALARSRRSAQQSRRAEAESWQLTEFQFIVTHREGLARRGELRTPHGVIQTPVFMPVGTRGRGEGGDAPAARGARRGDHPRQHLPPVPAARRRPHRARRRAAPLHRLGPSDPHRQRRLPGVQSGDDAADSRGGSRVPLAPRRRAARPHAGARHRRPGAARVGHRHGAGRVHRDAGHTRGRPGVDGSDPSAGRGALATASFS